MADFMKKHGKLIFIIYAIIIALLFLGAVFYMTKTANVHVGYRLNATTGEYEFVQGARVNSSVGSTNERLFRYFDRNKDANSPLYNMNGFEVVDANATNNIKKYGVDGKSIIDIIYNFQVSNSNFNTMIIIFGVISLVCYAIMILFSNHNRRIYYKSNLAAGILMPGTISVLSLVLLINNFALLGDFTKNFDLYRVTSFMMGDTDTQTKDLAQSDYNIVLEGTKNFNSLFYILSTLLFILVMAASVFMIIYTIFRYKSCTKERNEIIERAAKAND